MLLNHRSGLRNYTERSEFIPDVYEDRDEVHRDGILTSVRGRRDRRANEHFAYANTNYILLGQLLEKLDGTNLYSTRTCRCRSANGSDSKRLSFATIEAANPDGLAARYFHGGVPRRLRRRLRLDRFQRLGCRFARLDNGRTGQFLAALFAGELISQDSLDEMTSTGPKGYGFGLEAYQFPSGARFYGRLGGIDGYTSAMAFDPDTGDTLVVLTNNDMIYAGDLAGQIIDNWWVNQASPVTTPNG